MNLLTKVTILINTFTTLSTKIDNLEKEVKQLKNTNEKLVSIIIGASDYDAMKTNVRLSRNTYAPIKIHHHGDLNHGITK